MIYMPEESVYNKCYVVQNSDVIRGYDRIPKNNEVYNYRYYYINSSYIYRDFSCQWSSYTTLPTCLDSNVITNNVWYRQDIDKIVIVFVFIFFFIFFFIVKLFNRLIHGRRFK